MREAATVLDVLRERGRRGLPLERLYRQLFNPQLYLLAYGRLSSNKGAMTPGPDGETVDGMSMGKIGRIIDALRHERFRFKPVRRTYIPKKNGKKRPLGLPSWSDKLVGEVIRLLLEAYYEPQFSDRSHGFRPERGCHTALSEVATRWPGTTWFIEADIADCFGSLDHEIMLSTLAGDIHDGRFLRLLRNMLQAGYLDDWVWHETLSGAPQGGVASPILSNIYLHRLDTSRQFSSQNIPEAPTGHPTLTTKKWKSSSHGRADAGTAPRCAPCVSSGGVCRAKTPAIRGFGGCATCGTAMTTSSGSPDRRPKQRKSRSVWRRSCVKNSTWNCRRRKH
jgi:retron-type reverse transcriptase